jgi:signal transduction histidine kinase
MIENIAKLAAIYFFFITQAFASCTSSNLIKTEQHFYDATAQLTAAQAYEQTFTPATRLPPSAKKLQTTWVKLTLANPASCNEGITVSIDNIYVASVSLYVPTALDSHESTHVPTLYQTIDRRDIWGVPLEISLPKQNFQQLGDPTITILLRIESESFILLSIQANSIDSLASLKRQSGYFAGIQLGIYLFAFCAVLIRCAVFRNRLLLALLLYYAVIVITALLISTQFWAVLNCCNAKNGAGEVLTWLALVPGLALILRNLASLSFACLVVNAGEYSSVYKNAIWRFSLIQTLLSLICLPYISLPVILLSLYATDPLYLALILRDAYKKPTISQATLRLSAISLGLFAVVTLLLIIAGFFFDVDLKQAFPVIEIMQFGLGYALIVTINKEDFWRRHQTELELQDLTIKKVLDDRLLKARSAALDILSHETNHSLAIARFAAENLSNALKSDDEFVQNRINALFQGLDRAINIANHATTSTDTQHSQKKHSEINLGELINEQIVTKQLQRVVVNDPDALRTYSARDDIEIIISNLIDNAVNYRAFKSVIHVDLVGPSLDNPNFISIIFKNDISLGTILDRKRIFSRHYRGTTGFSTRGTGLGLHISKYLAEGLGGMLLFELIDSTAVFVLKLPIPAK